LYTLKKIAFACLTLLFVALSALAQEGTVQGIVFDKDSKQRINRVYIYNLRTQKGIYNNTKGEFNLNAQSGDVLVAALEGYGVDTLKVGSQSTLLIYLKRIGIVLDEVVVTDSVRSPESQLKEAREAYEKVYELEKRAKDLIKTGGGNGMGGAGIGIDALYNLISRQGRNARALQKIIEKDYQFAVVSYRYNRNMVGNVTGLKDAELTDFMTQYRPGYYFVMEANDYEMVKFIRESVVQYHRNPAARRLPPLNNP
jgi:hypothetical protein